MPYAILAAGNKSSLGILHGFYLQDLGHLAAMPSPGPECIKRMRAEHRIDDEIRQNCTFPLPWPSSFPPYLYP